MFLVDNEISLSLFWMDSVRSESSLFPTFSPSACCWQRVLMDSSLSQSAPPLVSVRRRGPIAGGLGGACVARAGTWRRQEQIWQQRFSSVLRHRPAQLWLGPIITERNGRSVNCDRNSDWTQACRAVVIAAADIGILGTSRGEGAWKLHGRRLKLSSG